MALQEALDQLVPLEQGSFSDIVEMTIDIPMRYAEWRGKTNDGAHVRLKHRHQLVGWSGPERHRRYYFRAGKSLVCINAGNAHMPIRQVEIWTEARCVAALSKREFEVRRLGSQVREITSVDGSLIFTDVSALAGERPPALDSGIGAFDSPPLGWHDPAQARYNEDVLR